MKATMTKLNQDKDTNEKEHTQAKADFEASQVKLEAARAQLTEKQAIFDGLKHDIRTAKDAIEAAQEELTTSTTNYERMKAYD